MQFSLEITYPAPLDKVEKMLQDRKYQEQRVLRKEITVNTIQIDSTSKDFSTVLDLTINMESLPPMFRSAVGNQVECRLIETWLPRNTKTIRDGQLKIDVPGKLVTIEATTTLRENDGTTIRNIAGEITTTIKLFGRMVEQNILKALTRIFAAEEMTAATYLEQP